MAAFTTRVELHGAAFTDYLALHVAMEQRRFIRTITGPDGQTHYLPTAEYISHGEIDKAEVLALAQSAVQETGKAGSILVTETVGWQWDSLPPV